MYRKIAAEHLANFLGILAHPIRIRIVEELREGELDVSSLQHVLKEPQSKISQNLSILKAQKIISERREGRRVFYRLSHMTLPEWLIEGLNIVQAKMKEEKKLNQAIESAKKTWRIKE